MSDASQEDGPQKSGRGRAAALIMVLILLSVGAGFALSYSGKMQLSDLMARKESDASNHIAFLDLPQIVLSLPGAVPKALAMSLTIEVDQSNIKKVKQLSPRILDSFNVFLSGVDPVAFERRGVLDIIKNELAIRARDILGSDGFSDILIMEFRIQ